MQAMVFMFLNFSTWKNDISKTICGWIFRHVYLRENMFRYDFPLYPCPPKLCLYFGPRSRVDGRVYPQGPCIQFFVGGRSFEVSLFSQSRPRRMLPIPRAWRLQAGIINACPMFSLALFISGSSFQAEAPIIHLWNNTHETSIINNGHINHRNEKGRRRGYINHINIFFMRY